MNVNKPGRYLLWGTALAAGLLVVAVPVEVRGQGRAYQPSLSGPSQRIGEFRKVGGSTLGTRESSYSARPRGEPTRFRSGGTIGNVGLGQGSGQLIDPTRPGFRPGPYAPTPTTGGTRGLVSPVQQGLFVPLADYPTIRTAKIDPEQAFKIIQRSRRARTAANYHDLPLIRPSTGERGELMTQLSTAEPPAYGAEEGGSMSHRLMIELRKDKLLERYSRYLQEGWAAFRAEDYAQAKLLFDSARSIQPQEPHGQFGKFATALASHHWQSSAKALHLMLDSKDYQLSDVLVAYADSLRDRHYPEPAKFDQDVIYLSQMAISSSGQSEVNGILAVMKWLGGSYREGVSVADAIRRVEPYSQWARLSDILRKATQMKTTEKPPESP